MIIGQNSNIIEDRLSILEQRLTNLERENAQLRKENAQLREENKELKDKLNIVLSQLADKKIKKDSHNSHNPPSQDKYRSKNRSLRKQTGRKPGGQKGHKGTTLLKIEKPDIIKELKSDYCTKCGLELEQEAQELLSTRQVIEIPPIKPIHIEYQQYGCTCTRCGNLQKAKYPKGITSAVQYGASIIALVSYFNVFQYIPYYRTKLLFKDIFNISMSEGSIQNLLNKAAIKAIPVYSKILKEIQRSTYIGSDETSAQVNGDKWWMWVWQNVKNTYIAASQSRGFETIKQIIGDSLSHITLGSDRWAAQLKMVTKYKQICLAHLLRDLIFLKEVEALEWAEHFEKLLSHALSLRRKAEKKNRPYRHNARDVYTLEQRLNRLLIRNIDKQKHPKTYTFQKSMIKNRNNLFMFLYDLEVPPDNNASERAIRNIKVKQKVSGQFKSGQNTFAVIRSVIDTLQKRNLNVLQNLHLIANFTPD